MNTKKQQAKVAKPTPQKPRALPPADPSLSEPTVYDSITMADYQKSIEQVGNAYEVYKKRMANMQARQKNGASATFTDSESSEEEMKETRPQDY